MSRSSSAIEFKASEGDDNAAAPPIPDFEVVSCSSMCRLPHDMPVEACTLSPDGRTFYSTTMDGKVCATWVQAGREKRTFGVDGMLSTGVVWASDLLLCDPMLFVAGAIELAPGTFQGVIKNYDLSHYTDDCAGTFMGHTGRVRSIDVPGRLAEGGVGNSSFTPRLLISGADDGTVRFWDVAEARAIVEVPAHQEGVHVVKSDPSNRNVVYTGGKDGAIKLWDVRERECAATFIVPEVITNEGPARPIADLTLTSDGSRLFSGAGGGGLRSGMIEWDKRTRSFLHKVGWHEGSILNLAVACEDTMLVSVSKDGSMQCRDLRPSKKGDDTFFEDPNNAFPVVVEQHLEKGGQEAVQERLPAWLPADTHAFTALCVSAVAPDARGGFGGDNAKHCVYTASTDIALREWDLSNLMIDTPLKQINKENEINETFDEAMERAFAEVEAHAEARAEKNAALKASAAKLSISAKSKGHSAPDLPEHKATSQATPASAESCTKSKSTESDQVPAWLKNNLHYKRMKRLKPEALVVLVDGVTIDSQSNGSLEAGEVGKLLSDDNTQTPFEVRGPRGDIGWYEESQIKAAPEGAVFEEVKPKKPEAKVSQNSSIEAEDDADADALAFYRNGGGLFGGINAGTYSLPDDDEYGADEQEEKDQPSQAADESSGGEEPISYLPPRTGGVRNTSTAEEREGMQRIDDSMAIYMQQRAAARSARSEAKTGAKKGGWRDRLNK